MKSLITSVGTFGPFVSIETLDDRYVCDGVEYHFDVVGEATIGDYVEPPPPPPSRDELKTARQAIVDAIEVTTASGNTFDGDETSQNRMARAIVALQATGTPSTVWVLSDNTAIQATAAELVEALALAGAAQARVWPI